MVDPARSPLDAPTLAGKGLPADVLQSFYRGAAERVLAQAGTPVTMA
jgi:hypothetical protein